jgi:hypothetical protein
MKKIVILSIATLALFASCKKSSSSSATGLTASVNGTSKNFGIAAMATKTHLAGVTQIEILGATSSTADPEVLSIQIGNDLTFGADSINAGTYSDTSTRFSVEVTYASGLTGSSPINYQGGTFVDGSQGPGTPATNHMTVVISSITNNSIKGTFSGNIYQDGDPGAASWPVVSGSFNLPMTQQ